MKVIVHLLGYELAGRVHDIDGQDVVLTPIGQGCYAHAMVLRGF
jgi:hypothetical protein